MPVRKSDTKYIHIEKQDGQSYCGKVTNGTPIQDSKRPVCLVCTENYLTYTEYRGFTIKYIRSEKHYRILGNKVLVLASVQACKNVINTYLRK